MELPKKYHEFIELFVKKEYRLPQHDDCYEARIPLIPGADLSQVKQFRKSPDELRVEDEFGKKLAGYIRNRNHRNPQETCCTKEAWEPTSGY
jgi:hypothetical protein